MIDDTLTKLKVWHAMQGHTHMVKMLSGEETAEEYLDQVERQTKDRIAKHEKELADKKEELLTAQEEGPWSDLTKSKPYIDGQIRSLENGIEASREYLATIESARELLKK